MSNVEWIKSSASAANGNCVEMANFASGDIRVRDSKDPDGPALSFEPDVFALFLADVKHGDFDALAGGAK